MTTPPHIKELVRHALTRIASGFDRVILYQFQILEEHRVFTDKHFSDSAKRFKESYEADISGMDEEEQAEYADFMIDEYTNMIDAFPRLQWYAQFLVVYSSFEHVMNDLCNIVKKRSNFELSFGDIQGQGILRASIYLKKVAGVHSPFVTADWNRALLLGDIRNAITHRNGEIPFDLKNKRGLAYRIKDLPNLKLYQSFEGQEDAEIILNTEFVRAAIKTMRKVLGDVANYELYK